MTNDTANPRSNTNEELVKVLWEASRDPEKYLTRAHELRREQAIEQIHDELKELASHRSSKPLSQFNLWVTILCIASVTLALTSLIGAIAAIVVR